MIFELSEALNNKERDPIYKALIKMIYYDMHNIFDEVTIEIKGQEYDSVKLRILFRLAYADYLLLSPAILEDQNGFVINRNIKNLFRKSNNILGLSGPYFAYKEKVSLVLFENQLSQIKNKFLTVLPQLKG